MAGSGIKPGRLPEPACVVQIDATLHPSESRLSHGFQRFNPSFNRTAVDRDLDRRHPWRGGGGNWQRGCMPTCARGQKLNPATRQCDVDHGGPPPAATEQAQLPPGQQRQAQAAEQQLAQEIAQVSTVEDAIARTAAAAQGLPPVALTQSIPGNTPRAEAVRAQCQLPQFPDGACKDQAVGNTCATLTAGATTNCAAAIVCPKTLGVCQGVTPEMKRLFDESMQRLVANWFAQHPGCTTFRQTGC